VNKTLLIVLKIEICTYIYI